MRLRLTLASRPRLFRQKYLTIFDGCTPRPRHYDADDATIGHYEEYDVFTAILSFGDRFTDANEGTKTHINNILCPSVI